MKFYDRSRELAFLRSIREESKTRAQMTILRGRRRVGKTALLQEAYGDGDYLYFFVARKDEADLCLDFQAEVARYFKMSLPGTVRSFEEIFRFLLELSEREHFTLVIDEFQDFLRVNPSIFSTMQRDWDIWKGRAKMNLVVSGSINRMMEQIFSAEQPLYGRATHEFRLDPFSTDTMREILTDCAHACDSEALLALWTLTGGVAKYIELLMDGGAFDPESMVGNFISDGSTILNEGKVLLVEEFRKDYGTYFSILSLIASGRTSRSEIQDVIGSDVGGYLTKLCEDYGIVAKKRPFAEEGSNRNMLYEIDDLFLRFWFRFVYRYQSAIELKAYGRLREFILRDYRMLSGKALESYFAKKLSESGEWTRMGSWWDRKGENEIDLIAVDEFGKRILFCEVKRNAAKISTGTLREKAAVFLRTHANYAAFTPAYRALSLSEM